MTTRALDATGNLSGLQHYCMTWGMLHFLMLLKSSFLIKATAKASTAMNSTLRPSLESNYGVQ